MTYDDYVRDGREARRAEEGALWRLAELAAGVESEHGALTRWAEDVGLSRARASELRSAWTAQVETKCSDVRTSEVGVDAMYALRAMPPEHRADFLRANPSPTVKDARQAAAPYRAVGKERPEFVEQDHSALYRLRREAEDIASRAPALAVDDRSRLFVIEEAEGLRNAADAIVNALSLDVDAALAELLRET